MPSRVHCEKESWPSVQPCLPRAELLPEICPLLATSVCTGPGVWLLLRDATAVTCGGEWRNSMTWVVGDCICCCLAGAAGLGKVSTGQTFGRLPGQA